MRPALKSVISMLRARPGGPAMRVEPLIPPAKLLRKRRPASRNSMAAKEQIPGRKGRTDTLRRRRPYVCMDCRNDGAGEKNGKEKRRKKDGDSWGLGGVILDEEMAAGYKKEGPYETLMNWLRGIDSPSEEDGEYIDKIKQSDYPQLYQALLERRDKEGDEGVIRAFDEWNLQERLLPPQFVGANKIWQLLLSVGVDNEEFLATTLKPHIQSYTAKYGSFGWAGVYETVVGKFMMRDQVKTIRWHMILNRHVPPSDWANFFVRAFMNTQPLRDGGRSKEMWDTIKSIHALTISPMAYSPVMKLLLERDRMEDALRWHRHCMRHNDFPKSSSEIDSLLGYVANTRNAAVVSRMLKRMHERNIPIEKSSILVLFHHRFLKVEVLKILIDLGESVRPLVQSTDFLILLMQTDLPAEHKIAFLNSWGPCELPAPALQALSLKYYDRDDFRTVVQEFLQFGFFIKESSYKVLMDRWYYRRYSPLEEGIVRALDKNDLETAIRKAHEVADKVHTIYPALQRDTLNAISRCAIRTEDTPINLHIIERFGNLNRTPEQVPTDNLSSLIILFLRLIKGDHPITPKSWTHIFKALGKRGRFGDLAQLALHLADFYKEDPLRRRRTFPSAFFRAVVEWGFLISTPKGPLFGSFLKPPLPKPPKPPPELSALPTVKRRFSDMDYTWGIRLSKAMKAKGVFVDPHVLRKAVRVRLRDIVMKRAKAGVFIDIGPQEVVQRCITEWGNFFETRARL